MTLKNFFSASYGICSQYRENMKRRSWVCLVSVLALFLTLPIQHAMEINAHLQRMARDPEYYFTVFGSKEEALQQMFLNTFSRDELTMIVIMGLAVMFAMQGFSWMNHSRKLDLYLSVPVSSKRRFTYIYWNGIWFFGLTYLLFMLLTVLIASLMGAGTVKIWGIAVLVWLGNMIFYLACYNLTLVAVMLTGKVLITICATVVLFGYEYLVRSLYDYLGRTFFRTYSSYSEIASGTISSPVYIWADRFAEGSDWFTGTLPRPDLLLQGCLILALQALVYGLAAWFLYRKRRAEAAGKAMAFGISKPLVSFLLVIPAALFIGLCFWELSDESILFAGIGLAIGILVGHCLLQVIYEADIRSIFGRKFQLIAAAAASGLIFAWFYMDLSGYDTYIPDMEEVENVAVAFPNDIYAIRVYDHLFEEDMESRNRTEYLLEHMKSKEPVTIEAVRQLAFLDMQQQKEQQYYEDGYVSLIIRYGLKNGNEKFRAIMVDCEEAVSQMDQIYSDDAFCRSRYQILDPVFLENADRIRISYENGMETFSYLNENQELIRVFAEEFRQYDFSMMTKQLPEGMLSIRYYPNGIENTDDWFQWGYPVYNDFTETVGLLTENGAFPEDLENGSYVSAEEVVSLTVTCYNQVEDEMDMTKEVMEDRTVVKTFSGTEEILAILPALYPQNLTDIAGSNMRYDLNNNNYAVSVVFDNAAGYEMQNQHFVVVEDLLPEEIREQLRYRSDDD